MKIICAPFAICAVVILIISYAIAYVCGAFMWIIMKLFPNSIFYYRKRIPWKFTEELLASEYKIAEVN